MHFVQPDTLIPDIYNPQSLNRYSYVSNNPIRYSDPSGHIRVDNEGGGGGGCTNTLCLPQPPNNPPSGGGGGSGGNNGGGQQPPPPGHDYWTETHDICADYFWINCTDDEVDDYLSRWQFPGQVPWMPIQPGKDYNVFPEEFNGYKTPIGYFWPGSGAIRVDKNGNIVTNIAYESHIFDGVVDRIKSRNSNGTPQITTHGFGTNTGFVFWMNRKNETKSIVVPGSFIDNANNNIGKFAFNTIDHFLLAYTTFVEAGQYLSGTQQLPQ